MFWTHSLLCCVQHFELEFIHNEGNDNLQYHQHDDEEAHEVELNQPIGFDL